MTAAYPTGTFPATFIGGAAGLWRIERSVAIAGAPLPLAPRLEVREGIAPTSGGVWRLAGVAGTPATSSAPRRRGSTRRRRRSGGPRRRWRR
jgi:hypothetical protein